MAWGRMSGIAGLILVASVVVACARNADGWWDEGVHAVDGYWVTSEGACPDEDTSCQDAIAVAKAILETTAPGSIVTRASMAGYPRCRGSGPNEGCFAYAGLMTPSIVILDLEGGGRRVIQLSCGAVDAVGTFGCLPKSYPMWRVGHREPAAP